MREVKFAGAASNATIVISRILGRERGGGAFAAALPIKDTKRKFPLPLDVFSWETLPSGRSETKTRKKISACARGDNASVYLI